jgi:hypothetical protein
MIKIKRKTKRIFRRLRKKFRSLSLLKKIVLIIFVIALFFSFIITLKSARKKESEYTKVKDVVDMKEDLDRLKEGRKYIPPTEDDITNQIMQLEKLRTEAREQQ